jgi:hypothetical protein
MLNQRRHRISSLPCLNSHSRCLSITEPTYWIAVYTFWILVSGRASQVQKVAIFSDTQSTGVVRSVQAMNQFFKRCFSHQIHTDSLFCFSAFESVLDWSFDLNQQRSLKRDPTNIRGTYFLFHNERILNWNVDVKYCLWNLDRGPQNI